MAEEKFKVEELRVLEVGSGLGYLTYALKQDGYKAMGMDISKNAVEEAKSNFGDNYICDDIFEYAATTTQTYDFIILTEVIEHVSSPVSFIKTLLSLLNTNGKLIVTTPNKSIYSNGTIWGSDLPPVHLWWFSEKSMSVISELTNSQVNFVTFEGFYERKPTIIDLEASRKFVSPAPVLNNSGNILNQINTVSFYDKFKSFVLGIKLAKSIYCRILMHRNPNIIKLTSKGSTMCAVFEKNRYGKS